MRALLVATLLGAGCFTPVDGGDCQRDSDCGGAVCTRVGECASQAYALRIRWTVAGTPADAATCAAAGITDLELAVLDPTTGAAHTVAPVPCAPGSFFYDKLPLGYTDVQLTAHKRDGSRDFASGSSIGAGGVLTLDLAR